MKTFGLTILAILMVCLLCLVGTNKENSAYAYGDNPQQEILKVQQDFAKWSVEHRNKYNDNMRKAKDQWERAEIQYKNDFDFNMKKLEVDKKCYEIQTGKRF